MRTTGQRHIYYISKKPEVGVPEFWRVLMVGLPLLLGLIIYGLMMTILTVWLIQHHHRRWLARNEEMDENNPTFNIFNPSHDATEETTRSQPKSGQQSSEYEK